MVGVKCAVCDGPGVCVRRAGSVRGFTGTARVRVTGHTHGGDHLSLWNNQTDQGVWANAISSAWAAERTIEG
jgi:hypothetical protein